MGQLTMRSKVKHCLFSLSVTLVGTLVVSVEIVFQNIFMHDWIIDSTVVLLDHIQHTPQMLYDV